MKQQSLAQYLHPQENEENTIGLRPIISQSPMMPDTPHRREKFTAKSSNKKVRFNTDLLTSIKKSKLRRSSKKGPAAGLCDKENQAGSSNLKSP